MATVLAPTVDDRALAFIAELILPSGARIGDSFAADSWVRDSVLVPVLAKRPDGLPEHRFVYVEMPKAVGKSTMGGAALLVECVMHAGTQGYVVATDVEQGRIIIEVLAELVSRFPRLKATVKQRGNEFRFSNDSFVRVLAADVPGSHGLAATARRARFVFDEWTQHANPGMYHSMLSTMTKVPDSAMWIFCNAGVIGSWQQEARDQLQATGAYTYITPEGWLPSWVNRADVEALKATLPLPLWERYFLNRWTNPTSTALTEAEFDACRADLPPLTAAEPVVIGIDAGVRHDCFAIVCVSRALPAPADNLPAHYRSPTDGPRTHRFVDYNLTARGLPFGLSLYEQSEGDTDPPEVWVREVKVWQPQGAPLDFGQPYKWLSEFVRSHHVENICYDPYQLHSWAQNFRAEHGAWMSEFPQGPLRSQSDIAMLQLVRAGRIKHSGDPALREHALNAALKVGAGEDSKGRLVKSAPNKHIDSAVALSMAAHQVLRLVL